MACTGIGSRDNGVISPLFRIEVNTQIFERRKGFITQVAERMKVKKLPIFDKVSHYFVNQLFSNSLELIDVFKVMGSGSYVFCTLKGATNFKLFENEVETVHEKFREVPVLTNVKKVSDVNLEMTLFYFNQRTILEYLFFVMLYRFRAYNTFTVKVDYVNRMFFTVFSYDFEDCILKTAETNFEQAVDDFGNFIPTASRPLKFILTVVPYNVRIRI